VCYVVGRPPEDTSGRRTCPAVGEGYGPARATYVRRRPEHTVLLGDRLLSLLKSERILTRAEMLDF